MSDAAAFTILGMVALAVGWPTWVWAIAFALVAIDTATAIAEEES